MHAQDNESTTGVNSDHIFFFTFRDLTGLLVHETREMKHYFANLETTIPQLSRLPRADTSDSTTVPSIAYHVPVMFVMDTSKKKKKAKS